MIRFLLVLLAFVSALLAFIFQETVLFVASGGLLLVSVILLLLQVREQSKRKNRLKLPNDLTPQDELRARGVLEIRPKAKPSVSEAGYAPPLFTTPTSEQELRQHGILEVREKRIDESFAPSARGEDEKSDAPRYAPQERLEDLEPEIPWSVVADEESYAPVDLFAEPSGDPAFGDEDEAEADSDLDTTHFEPMEEELGGSFVFQPIEDRDEDDVPADHVVDTPEEFEMADATDELESEPAGFEEPEDVEEDEIVTPVAEAPAPLADEPGELTPTHAEASREERRELERHRAARRKVEVDAHLPALQISLGAHTICLIDVDFDTSVYRLRSIVSSGLVDNAGTEYPFAGFFLSDLLAETTVIDIGPNGLAVADLRYHRDPAQLEQVVAAPVMKNGLPAAFLVAGFESRVTESSRQAVTQAAAFFSTLYALQDDHPASGDSPLVRAKRKPPSLRLVKSNPKSSQSKIIAEEMNKARGQSYPMAFALVCLDRGDEISRADELTVYKVEEWMRRCLEQITPDGRIEYLGELGYGIIQLRDVSDVEGWVRRAQQIFRSQHGPVDAQPIVGVAMLSEGHRDPEDLQADAVRALRAAYETGDSTILVG